MENKKKLKTQKQALKEPLGTFYHPTKNTYRTGACNIGEVMKKGYTKKLKNKEIYVGPTCVKNKGKPGILINNKNNLKIKENLKMEKYISNIKKTSYKSVILKLKSQLKKKDLDNNLKKNLEIDIELLEKWRKNNPNKKINDKKVTNKNLIKVSATNEKLFNSSIKEFHKNLNIDFLPKKNKKISKTNKIKELTTKEILNLIKNK